MASILAVIGFVWFMSWFVSPDGAVSKAIEAANVPETADARDIRLHCNTSAEMQATRKAYIDNIMAQGTILDSIAPGEFDVRVVVRDAWYPTNFGYKSSLAVAVADYYSVKRDLRISVSFHDLQTDRVVATYDDLFGFVVKE